MDGDKTGKVYAFSPGMAGMDVDRLSNSPLPGFPPEEFTWGWSDSGGEQSSWMAEHRVSFKRAIACVKAMEGIENPSALVEAAREIIRTRDEMIVLHDADNDWGDEAIAIEERQVAAVKAIAAMLPPEGKK